MDGFKSTKEIYEYLINGGKVRHRWGEIVHMDYQGNVKHNYSMNTPSEWSKFFEPKTKVKLYKYAFRNISTEIWNETARFFSDDNEFITWYSPLSGVVFKRLDYTVIEVEE